MRLTFNTPPSKGEDHTAVATIGDYVLTLVVREIASGNKDAFSVGVFMVGKSPTTNYLDGFFDTYTKHRNGLNANELLHGEIAMMIFIAKEQNSARSFLMELKCISSMWGSVKNHLMPLRVDTPAIYNIKAELDSKYDESELWKAMIRKYPECESGDGPDFSDCTEACQDRITTDVEDIETEIRMAHCLRNTPTDRAVIEKYTWGDILVFLHREGMSCLDNSAVELARLYVADLIPRVVPVVTEAEAPRIGNQEYFGTDKIHILVDGQTVYHIPLYGHEGNPDYLEFVTEYEFGPYRLRDKLGYFIDNMNKEGINFELGYDGEAIPVASAWHYKADETLRIRQTANDADYSVFVFGQEKAELEFYRALSYAFGHAWMESMTIERMNEPTGYKSYYDLEFITNDGDVQSRTAIGEIGDFAMTNANLISAHWVGRTATHIKEMPYADYLFVPDQCEDPLITKTVARPTHSAVVEKTILDVLKLERAGEVALSGESGVTSLRTPVPDGEKEIAANKIRQALT